MKHPARPNDAHDPPPPPPNPSPPRKTNKTQPTPTPQNSTLELTDCVVKGNLGDNNAGAFWLETSNMTATNVRVCGFLDFLMIVGNGCGSMSWVCVVVGVGVHGENASHAATMSVYTD